MFEELERFIKSHVDLEPKAWEDMMEVLKIKQLRKKQHFLRQGEFCKSIGFIVSGYMRLYYLVNGEEITKDFNFENSFCGSYASFSLQKPSLFNVVAMEDAQLYLIGQDDLYRLFDSYPSIQKMGRLNMEYMFIKKELRESSFLLDSAEQRYKELMTQYPSIQQRVPLKYLASYLGITAETLSRIRKNEMEADMKSLRKKS